MHTTVFHSADLPRTERPDRFDGPDPDSGSGSGAGSGSESGAGARAGLSQPTARALDLGPVNIVELTCSPSLVRRAPALIRQADPELCSVVFPRRGALVVTQAGREALLGERDLTLYDSSRPFGVRTAGRGTVTLVRGQMPRALLPLSAHHTDRLLGTRLPGREGVGALLTRFLSDLAAGQPSGRRTGFRRRTSDAWPGP
ncbi:hypothetical protein ABIE67_005809 [Streptomyces sp. V4I8]|uniref:AraC-like ligand-binding domain-containing protein n=1 Tax=Streptomyces sp. V4I8 TaxID=3156469 RepID=UPI0035142AE9